MLVNHFQLSCAIFNFPLYQRGTEGNLLVRGDAPQFKSPLMKLLAIRLGRQRTTAKSLVIAPLFQSGEWPAAFHDQRNILR